MRQRHWRFSRARKEDHQQVCFLICLGIAARKMKNLYFNVFHLLLVALPLTLSFLALSRPCLSCSTHAPPFSSSRRGPHRDAEGDDCPKGGDLQHAPGHTTTARGLRSRCTQVHGNASLTYVCQVCKWMKFTSHQVVWYDLI